MSDWDSAFNVVSFGAVGDGVTDDTLALQAALNAAADTTIRRRVDERGGRVFLPAGKYAFSSTLTFPSRGCILEGAGSGATGGAHASAQLLYTATDSSSALNAQNSTGTVIRDLQVFTSNTTYTGRLVDLRNVSGSDTALTLLERCTVAGPAGGSAVGVDFDKCNTAAVLSTNFTNLAVGIQGKSSNGSYSNQIEIGGGCQFVQNSTAHVKNPGQAWDIHNCTFEQLTGNNAGAIAHDSGVLAQALTIRGNWFGDVGIAGTGAQITVAGSDAIVIMGNMIGFNNGSKGIVIDGSNIDGLTVIGNRFDGGSGTCWDFGATTGHTKISDIANHKVGSGTYINNPPAGIFQA